MSCDVLRGLRCSRDTTEEVVRFGEKGSIAGTTLTNFLPRWNSQESALLDQILPDPRRSGVAMLPSPLVLSNVGMFDTTSPSPGLLPEWFRTCG